MYVMGVTVMMKVDDDSPFSLSGEDIYCYELTTFPLGGERTTEIPDPPRGRHNNVDDESSLVRKDCKIGKEFLIKKQPKVESKPRRAPKNEPWPEKKKREKK